MKKRADELDEEVQSLHASVASLEAKVDTSFGEGYFFAGYQVAQALPPLFDFSIIDGWSREEIMAKAARLAKAAPTDEAGPSQVVGANEEEDCVGKYYNTKIKLNLGNSTS